MKLNREKVKRWDEQIYCVAEEIIKAQESEIITMSELLGG